MHYFAQRIGCVLHLAWVGMNVDSVAHQGGVLESSQDKSRSDWECLPRDSAC